MAGLNTGSGSPLVRPVVLLVEDEPLLVLTTQAALEDAGHEVVVASNGTEALELLEDGLRPSALVTDIRLGNGPNGWQLAVHARTEHPDLPVIYVSGDFGEEGDERAVHGSVVLHKPINARLLLLAVATCLAGTAQVVEQGRGSNVELAR